MHGIRKLRGAGAQGELKDASLDMDSSGYGMLILKQARKMKDVISMSVPKDLEGSDKGR